VADLITAIRFADRAKDHDALPPLDRLRDAHSESLESAATASSWGL
jgi:hypothetical protein